MHAGEDDAFERFWQTGRIADYLGYVDQVKKQAVNGPPCAEGKSAYQDAGHRAAGTGDR